MSTEPTPETDTEPTPGPWVVGDPSQGVVQKQSETGKLPRVVAITDWAKDREGHEHPRADEMRANARLIAAAGTAAHEVKEMGYDPIGAMVALPDLIKAARHAKLIMETEWSKDRKAMSRAFEGLEAALTKAKSES